MYKPLNPSRPGIRLPINLNITAFAAASGILAASSTKKYRILGWDLSVPSGVIAFKFTDGTDDLSGNHYVSSSAAFGNTPLTAGAFNRGLKIKAGANVSNLVGDVYYEEIEYNVQPQSAALTTVKWAPGVRV